MHPEMIGQVLVGCAAAIAEADALGDSDKAKELKEFLGRFRQIVTEMNLDCAKKGREAMQMTWDELSALDQAARDRLHTLVAVAAADTLEEIWKIAGVNSCALIGWGNFSNAVTWHHGDMPPTEEYLRQLSRRNNDLAVWLFAKPIQME